MVTLKQEYIEAYRADTLREYNKELLQVTGNTRELNQIQLAENIREWEARFEAAGLKADEAKGKIQKLHEELERKNRKAQNKEDINFLQGETGMLKMFGQYQIYQKIMLQNIEDQYNELKNKLGPEAQRYLDTWKTFQTLKINDSPLSGIVEKTADFVNENTNYAEKFGDIWGNALDSIGDKFADLCIKGEADFTELANSIIQDITRMMIKSVEAQAVEGLMSLVGGAVSKGLGGLFGGSVNYGMAGMSSSGATLPALPGAGAGAGLAMAKGGVMSGGSLHEYANTVVSEPTLFRYGRVAAFAQGAGLMGEAGPEAIMPLTRTSDGTLGVQAQGMANQLQLSLTIVDQTQNGIEAQDAQARQNGMSLSVIVDQIDGALASRARNNKSRLVQYLDSSRGMSNARSLY